MRSITREPSRVVRAPGSLVAGAALLVAALLPVACKEIGAPEGPPEADGGPSRIVVQIVDFAFVAPDGSSAVTASPGDTIVFVNRDAAPHTATSTSAPPGQAFDSGTLGQDESFEFVPTATGEWTYRCDFHPVQMRGARIRVVPEGEPAGDGAAPGGAGSDGAPGDSAGAGGDGSGSAGASGTVTIEIRNFAFVAPNGTDTITIALGQTVEFVNLDDASHTATSTGTPSGGSSFDSGRLRTGDRYSWTPSTEGTWIYRCDFHVDEMSGAVIRVVDDGSGGGAGSGSDDGGASGAVVPVRITSSGYVGPDGQRDVTISLGETVEWVNEDVTAHTVRSTEEPDGGRRFDSEDLAPGERYRFTPDRTGVWEYRCDFHGDERGMRIVVG